MSPADRDEVFTHFSDPRVAEFLDDEPIVTRGQADEIVDWAQRILSEGTGVRWVLRDADGVFLGTCGFHRIVRARGARAEIGFDLGPAWWGRGIMSRVVTDVLAYGFGPLGLHRIEALVSPGNVRSCRLLERSGFRREGLLRGYGFWGGVFHDQELWSRLATDRPASGDDDDA